MLQSNIEKSPIKASETGSAENIGLFCLLSVVCPDFRPSHRAEYINKYSCQLPYHIL